MSIKNIEVQHLIGRAASIMGKKGGPAAAAVRFAKMTAEERSQYGKMMAHAKKLKKIASQAQGINNGESI